MSKEKEIQEIEKIKSKLEYHLKKYIEYKYDSKNASRQKDRKRASNNMFNHAEYIERELFNPLVASEISNGSQFQFEDFWKYVESDLPDYIEKIDFLLERLKTEKEKE